MNIGEQIRALREEHGMSQQELADVLNVSRSSITKYERNEREPGYSVILKMSDYFGVPSDYILARTTEADKNEYRYSSEVERLKKTRPFSFSNEFSREEQKALSGLLSNYLSVVDDDRGSYCLDLLYLCHLFEDAVTQYYYSLFTDTYEVDAEIFFNMRKVSTQELLKMQRPRIEFTESLNKIVESIDRLALDAADCDDEQPATDRPYFIKEIVKRFSVQKGKEMIESRQHVYDMFKGRRVKPPLT